MPASSTVYYHVTPTCNVPRIMREGLLPRRGPDPDDWASRVRPSTYLKGARPLLTASRTG